MSTPKVRAAPSPPSRGRSKKVTKPRFLEIPSRPIKGSLRRTLLTWLMLPLVVLVPLTTALIYGIAVRPALDGLDRALTDTAVALTGILAEQNGLPSLPLSAQTARALQADLVDAVAFAVGDDAGHLLGGDAALLPLRPPVGAGEWKFFDASLHGRDMRVASYGAACGVPARVCVVMVAESLGKRRDAERAVALAALAAALLLSSSMVLLALLAARHGLLPLEKASAEIESRTLQRLDPIDPRSVPREVASFVVALNALFDRLRHAGSAQRAFIENASHQLRTPLATILSESSQALAGPHPAELRPALERLHAAAHRGAHLAQQLLTLARLDNAALDLAAPRTDVDLAALAAESANDWLGPSLAANQDLGFDLQRSPVRGNALLLQELMSNLVDNAIRHAGPGATVTLRTRAIDARVLIEVEDNGKGLAEGESQRIWERFHRGDEATGPGTGLGLTIVRDIARLHGGDAEACIGRNGRGVIVTVTLPLGA
jgi:two-component system sensor histidine kinase TctE